MNQRRTKERPKNAEIENVRFVKIALSFFSLIPCLKTPSDDRENSERTPTQLPAYKKCFFLRWVPIKLFLFLKRLTRILKLLTIFLKTFTPFLKRFTPCCAFRAHLLLCFTPNKHKKCTFPQKKCIFLYILTSFSSLPYYLCSRFHKNRMFNH